MGKLERIRAVRRVISLVEGLIAAFDEVASPSYVLLWTRVVQIRNRF
jgi:hypothetical protein